MAINKLPHTNAVADQPPELRKLQAYVRPVTQKSLRATAALQGRTIGEVIDDVVADSIGRLIDVEGLSNDPALTKGNHAA